MFFTKFVSTTTATKTAAAMQADAKIMLAHLIVIQWIRLGRYIMEVGWVLLTRSAGWLFCVNGSLRHYVSLYQVVSRRIGERNTILDERNNVIKNPAHAACIIGPFPTII